ncbi:DUF805 domain-containing protein [Bacillus sp. EB600]|uniref:DUF805 domain-containing protein n=1 Tax=Bacillus sp. EB600 TaxID=2806345 RepID=UPI00210C0742|nr:DUF805 domain-containing protein [Bacillus sp. EB600]MCQ6279989.1 DUF805 domain-containing protein [Bacillus sp. EB600]
MQWYVKVLQNYTGFQGRAARTEYWMFVLFNVIVSIVLSIVESVTHLGSYLTGIYSLAVLLPSLAVGARRLHDTGRSGWWLLLSIIPLIGAIILLIYTVQDSQESENQYGPNPKLEFTK